MFKPLPVLVLVFFWTYISYRKKEEETLESELEKLRTGVRTECRRILSDASRERMSQLGNHYAAFSRSLLSQVDARLREHEQRQRSATETQRLQSMELGKALDAQLRDLQKRRKESSGFGADLRDTVRKVAEWGRTLAGDTGRTRPGFQSDCGNSSVN